MPPESLPAFSSVSPNPPNTRPLASSGTNRRFCSSVPKWTIGDVPSVVCAEMVIACDAQTFAVSWIAIALAGVRDAQGTVHERLESNVGDRGADLTDVFERVLAGEHDAVDAKLSHHSRAAGVVHGHLRRRMHLESGVYRVNQPDETDVLYDRGCDSAVDCLSEQRKRVGDLVRLDQRVQRQVDANAARRGERARAFQLIERELRALVAGIEALGPEVNRVGAVRDGRPDGIQ